MRPWEQRPTYTKYHMFVKQTNKIFIFRGSTKGLEFILLFTPFIPLLSRPFVQQTSVKRWSWAKLRDKLSADDFFRFLSVLGWYRPQEGFQTSTPNLGSDSGSFRTIPGSAFPPDSHSSAFLASRVFIEMRPLLLWSGKLGLQEAKSLVLPVGCGKAGFATWVWLICMSYWCGPPHHQLPWLILYFVADISLSHYTGQFWKSRTIFHPLLSFPAQRKPSELL